MQQPPSITFVRVEKYAVYIRYRGIDLRRIIVPTRELTDDDIEFVNTTPLIIRMPVDEDRMAEYVVQFEKYMNIVGVIFDKGKYAGRRLVDIVTNDADYMKYVRSEPQLSAKHVHQRVHMFMKNRGRPYCMSGSITQRIKLAMKLHGGNLTDLELTMPTYTNIAIPREPIDVCYP